MNERIDNVEERAMVRAKELPKLTARRTPDIEGLLQELWSLRPELENKNKVTILLSLAALVRECKKVYPAANDCFSSAEESLLGPAAKAKVIEKAPVSSDIEWRC
ncbi:MAG: hypothetical protein HLUCCA11_22300 [Phormidesmis priestleyi Ana]|uniref:Uncharacterized protein n=1 Tax=Phormidesmis priestleyi Ana TaxID=1666911 RepID=A0A0P8BEN1_9CYAN|nr:MAG: hypothetical protein HLUCCA11_22300 [Phormidesmis priestleyi Ana]